MQALASHPPPGVDYVRTGGFHEGGQGVRCQTIQEVLLNRVVHPLAVPDMGFRALRLVEPFDLVHVHAHPVRLRGLRGVPVVMSEGSSAAVYLGDYLGWDDARLSRGLARARRMYRALGIADRLLTLERAAGAYVFSDWAREVNLRWGADPGKLRVVAPGFPVAGGGRPLGSRVLHFLFVGGDFERKGGFELVEAFAEAVRQWPHMRLVLAGSDSATRNPDRLLHEWVRKNAVPMDCGQSRSLNERAPCAGSPGCRATPCSHRSIRTLMRSRCQPTPRASASRTSRRCRSVCLWSPRPSGRRQRHRQPRTDGPPRCARRHRWVARRACATGGRSS